MDCNFCINLIMSCMLWPIIHSLYFQFVNLKKGNLLHFQSPFSRRFFHYVEDRVFLSFENLLVNFIFTIVKIVALVFKRLLCVQHECIFILSFIIKIITLLSFCYPQRKPEKKPNQTIFKFLFS